MSRNWFLQFTILNLMVFSKFLPLVIMNARWYFRKIGCGLPSLIWRHIKFQGSHSIKIKKLYKDLKIFKHWFWGLNLKEMAVDREWPDLKIAPKFTFYLWQLKRNKTSLGIIRHRHLKSFPCQWHAQSIMKRS